MYRLSRTDVAQNSNLLRAQCRIFISLNQLVMYFGAPPGSLGTRCMIALPFSVFFVVVVCFSLDKLRCLEEDQDPEVIPEDTGLLTLGYGGPCFYSCYLFKYFLTSYYSKVDCCHPAPSIQPSFTFCPICLAVCPFLLLNPLSCRQPVAPKSIILPTQSGMIATEKINSKYITYNIQSISNFVFIFKGIIIYLDIRCKLNILVVPLKLYGKGPVLFVLLNF